MEPGNETKLTVADAEASPAVPIAGRSLWADAWRKLVRDKAAIVCLAVIILYALVAAGATIYEYVAESDDKDNILAFREMDDDKHVNQSPSWSWRNLLGTDWSGKPVIVKTLMGAKVSMTVGLMANVIAVPLGMILGAIAGYYGGWIDDIIVWLYTTLLSIPGIILLIAMKYAFKDVTILGLDLTGIHGMYLALAIVSWVGICRLVRAEVLKIRELDYVIAARATGRNGFSILLHHIIPNVLHLGIIRFSLGFVAAVQLEVMLSYLGLGVAVDQPSWGSMINSARQDIFQGRWWELTSAVTAMFFLVLALNIFGDRLRDALDPKLKNV